MPTAPFTTTTLTAPADGAVTADDIARTATILAFPPMAADVAAIAADIGRMPITKLLPTSRNMLELVELRAGDPASSTADLHAVFGAMLGVVPRVGQCRLSLGRGNTGDASMSAPIAEPLPPVIELGRSLAALEADYRLLDEATAARGATQSEKQRMDLLHFQEETLRELISTIPAATLADAAVQIGVACALTSQLEASDWRQACYQHRLHRLLEAAHRITLSALPVVAKSAGLHMDAMGWSSNAQLRAYHFGLEGAE